MSFTEVPPAVASTSIIERLPTIPIRPRVFHIVSPLTGSKATIITTDTTSSPNHAPVLIQAAQRINRSSVGQLSSTRKRVYPFTQEADTNAYLSTLAAHRHRERLSKGLRYFSKKVCNKVQAKKITSYNEVATELVGEYTIEEKRNLQLPENELAYEQKNIRRRVYDAINVLLAMNIITKDKKDIRWVGFPVNALFECELIDKKTIEIKETIRDKVRLVEDALLKLGFSKELRGGVKSQHNIEQARALLPEAFWDFATEMAMSGSLKTLFETRTSSNRKTRTSTTIKTPVVFVPPSFFKVDDDPQEVEYEEEEVFEEDDDVLSISSDDDEITQS
ncbi:unnamed protein product [Rotaria socialis]|uniref:E2F/DP family winged-helix DNA-binding domain-containing protein n=1 Tax=Rotaria socialis TaxID=392032 RepID=A0A820N5I4_9BILA|nr:unnamed protein product [Rotaria socialis]